MNKNPSGANANASHLYITKQEVLDRFTSCGHTSEETALLIDNLRYWVENGSVYCLKGQESYLDIAGAYPMKPDSLPDMVGSAVSERLIAFLFTLNPVVVNRESNKLPPELKNYPITVSWSEEDNLYLARTPAFPFVMAHGDTPEEAAKEMTIALTGVIELLNEKGRGVGTSPPLVLPDESTLGVGNISSLEPSEEVKALRRLHTEVGKLYKPSFELSNAWSNAGYVLSKGDKNPQDIWANGQHSYPSQRRTRIKAGR